MKGYVRMVLPASDSLQSEFGFGGDATQPMPDFEGAMPDGGDDSVLSGDEFVDEAATEATDESFSIDALPPEHRAILDQHYRAQYDQQFARDKANLQRTLEGQKSQVEGRLNAALREMASQQAWFENYLTQAAKGEVSPDPRDFAVFMQQMNQARVQHQASEQAQHQGFESWLRESYGRMQQKVAEQARDDDGTQIFNPDELNKDPAFIRLTQDMYQKAYPAHARGASPEAQRAYHDAFLAHQQYVARWRENKKVELVSGRRRSSAQQQQAARSRQQQRGRQDTSQGGAAGGAPDIAAMIAAIQAESPKKPYADVHREAFMRLNPTG